MKQFCLRGHDTFICGRNTAHQCKECYRISHRVIKKSHSHQRKHWLKHQFNISLDEYQALLAKQNFRCATCYTPASEFERSLAVDHDHETGQIRGLLCGPCNMALGLVKDNPSILTNLMQYLAERNPLIGQV